MLTWLKKFVLDILPSVAATIIGAYIVNHYIIPKSRSAEPQPSIASVISSVLGSKSADASAGKASVEKTSFDASSFEKGVAEKAAIEKTVAKAASDKAATGKAATDKAAAAAAERTASIDKSSDGAADADLVESRKHRPAPKSAAKPAAAAPAQEERKASDLARAALERLRGGSSDQAKETAKLDAAKSTDLPRVQPVSTIASAPPMQPLPPAISVDTPKADAFEQGNAAPVVRQPYPLAATRLDELHRFAPPADIPASQPLDLRAEVSGPSSRERGSVTDDVVSAAKSMFHAVIPH